MRPGVTPHHISPLLPFHHGVTDYDVGGFSGVSRGNCGDFVLELLNAILIQSCIIRIA